MPDQTMARRGRPARLPSDAAGNSTAQTVLELLKVITGLGRPVPLTDLAAAAQMSASRTHRYLSSLIHTGFVRQDPTTGHYDVGPATIEVGIAASQRFQGSRLTDEVMKELTSRTGLCSYLCVWGSNGPTVIRDEMGEVQTIARMRMGSNLSMLTATGQIFLAFMPEGVTRETLLRDLQRWNAETPDRAVTLDHMMEQRTLVQASRMARTTGMRNPTWTAFSCPVFDMSGSFRMALTLIGVSMMYDTRLDGTVALALKTAAQKLAVSFS
jgi:DNA-binding IclR family transcriptional regulator